MSSVKFLYTYNCLSNGPSSHELYCSTQTLSVKGNVLKNTSNNKYRVSLLPLIIVLFCRHGLVALTKFTAMVINEPCLLWLPDSLEQLWVVSAVINSTMAVKYLNEFSGFNSLKLSVHKIPDS